MNAGVVSLLWVLVGVVLLVAMIVLAPGDFSR